MAAHSLLLPVCLFASQTNPQCADRPASVVGNDGKHASSCTAKEQAACRQVEWGFQADRVWALGTVHTHGQITCTDKCAYTADDLFTPGVDEESCNALDNELCLSLTGSDSQCQVRKHNSQYCLHNLVPFSVII